MATPLTRWRIEAQAVIFPGVIPSNWRAIRFNTTHRGWLILAALLLLHINLWQLWLARGDVAKGCDVFAHLNHQLLFNDTLTSLIQEPSLDKARRLLSSPEIAPAKWPRFTYLVSSIGTALVGRGTQATVLFTSGVFTLVLLLSLLSLGRRLFGPRAALLGCVLFTFFPYTAHFANSYGLDYPLTCMVTLSWAALVRTEGFRSRRFSMLFALAFSLTLLTKVQGILFIVGPMIWVALAGLRVERGRASGRIRVVPLNLALSGSLAAIILAALLPGDPGAYLSTFLYHTGATGLPATMVKEQLSLQSLLFYPLTLALGISPWILLLALFSLCRRGAPGRGFMLVALITPLVIFTLLISTKWQRFLLPATPLLALAAADLLLRVRGAKLRTALVAGVLLMGSAQLGVMMFYKDIYSPIQSRLGKAGLMTTNSFAHPPAVDNYHDQVGEVVKLLRSHSSPHAPLHLAIIEDPEIGPGAAVVLQYMVRLHNNRSPLTVHLSGQRPGPFIKAASTFNQILVLSHLQAKPSTLLPRIYESYLDPAAVAKAWPRNKFNYRTAEVRHRFSHAATLPELFRTRLKPLGINVYVLGVSEE